VPIDNSDASHQMRGMSKFAYKQYTIEWHTGLGRMYAIIHPPGGAPALGERPETRMAEGFNVLEMKAKRLIDADIAKGIRKVADSPARTAA
jgi:hypothetical protein